MTKKHYILLPSPLHESYILKFKDGVTQIGPTINFTIESGNCTPVTLIWLNAKGGWDSYAFDSKREEGLDSVRSYSRRQIDGLTNSQRSTDGIESGISGRVFSEFLDAETLEFISGIIESPVVYLVHLDNGGYNYLPVNILTRQLPRKSNQLVNVQIEYQLAVERLNQNSLNIQPHIPSPSVNVEWENLWS